MIALPGTGTAPEILSTTKREKNAFDLLTIHTGKM